MMNRNNTEVMVLHNTIHGITLGWASDKAIGGEAKDKSYVGGW
jgi:hypothetical protein